MIRQKYLWWRALQGRIQAKKADLSAYISKMERRVTLPEYNVPSATLYLRDAIRAYELGKTLARIGEQREITVVKHVEWLDKIRPRFPHLPHALFAGWAASAPLRQVLLMELCPEEAAKPLYPHAIRDGALTVDADEAELLAGTSVDVDPARLSEIVTDYGGVRAFLYGLGIPRNNNPLFPVDLAHVARLITQRSTHTAELTSLQRLAAKEHEAVISMGMEIPPEASSQYRLALFAEEAVTTALYLERAPAGIKPVHSLCIVDSAAKGGDPREWLAEAVSGDYLAADVVALCGGPRESVRRDSYDWGLPVTTKMVDWRGRFLSDLNLDELQVIGIRHRSSLRRGSSSEAPKTWGQGHPGLRPHM